MTLSDSIEAEIHWHPFELNPNMPAMGQELTEHVMEKYGSTPEQSRQSRERIAHMGAELGFEFHYRDGQRIVNTFQAHQLLSWAGELAAQDEYDDDVQTRLKLALFKAYFQDGVDVSQPQQLVQVAATVGLNVDDAKAVLAGQQYAAAVRAEQQQWQQMGINAVPAVVLHNKYLIQGGQPADVFEQAINQVLAEQTVSAS